MTISYDSLYLAMQDSLLETWAETLPRQLEERRAQNLRSDFFRWQKALNNIKKLAINDYSFDLNSSAITLSNTKPLDKNLLSSLEQELKILSPWRKGPFNLFGINIDSEWRSDWKWNRIAPHLSPLEGRTVLDVGCGSGYHCWRLRGAGAKLVIGIDPSTLFSIQFETLKQWMPDEAVFYLPLRIEALPEKLEAFDTVLSMGILYHRRSPLDHLLDLFHTLKPGGELLLETLVIEGKEGEILLPHNRYAQMRNVWFIPSCDTLINWLTRMGFKDVQLVDSNQTSLEEQRQTQWMQFQSLSHFLDPKDKNKTIEGYPAPIRAAFIARRP